MLQLPRVRQGKGKSMTRGTSILILPDKMLISSEFNGDMYLDPYSNGEAMVYKLEESNSIIDYIKKLHEFNNERFGYKDISVYQSLRPAAIIFNEYSYFEKWFSDFLFFKNLFSKSMLFIDKNGHRFRLKSGDIAVYYFGVFHSYFKAGLPRPAFR